LDAYGDPETEKMEKPKLLPAAWEAPECSAEQVGHRVCHADDDICMMLQIYRFLSSESTARVRGIMYWEIIIQIQAFLKHFSTKYKRRMESSKRR